jgi:hypothetical protein
LVANGKMFVTGSYSRVLRRRQQDRREAWQYEHRLPEGDWRRVIAPPITWEQDGVQYVGVVAG